LTNFCLSACCFLSWLIAVCFNTWLYVCLRMTVSLLVFRTCYTHSGKRSADMLVYVDELLRPR
jgi:hypothetical protein